MLANRALPRHLGLGQAPEDTDPCPQKRWTRQGENGAGPHAVTTVKNGTTTKARYAYDANGRITTRTVDGATIQFDYTAFNQPATLRNPEVVTSFKYDPSRNRMVQSVLSTTSGRRTVTYLNLSATGEALYEKEETSSLTVHKHFIFGPMGRVAEVDVEAASSGTSQTTKYFFKDHLGSIDLVRVYAGHITGLDSATNRAHNEYLSFDAFGQRRTAGAWVNSRTLAAAYTERGYTGHEHLDDFGLIHMTDSPGANRNARRAARQGLRLRLDYW